jgi:hypothetical protein
LIEFLHAGPLQSHKMKLDKIFKNVQVRGEFDTVPRAS